MPTADQLSPPCLHCLSSSSSISVPSVFLNHFLRFWFGVVVVASPCTLTCPKTRSADQAALELTESHLILRWVLSLSLEFTNLSSLAGQSTMGPPVSTSTVELLHNGIRSDIWPFTPGPQSFTASTLPTPSLHPGCMV